jgi:hypothetical protein
VQDSASGTCYLTDPFGFRRPTGEPSVVSKLANPLLISDSVTDSLDQQESRGLAKDEMTL